MQASPQLGERVFSQGRDGGAGEALNFFRAPQRIEQHRERLERMQVPERLDGSLGEGVDGVSGHLDQPRDDVRVFHPELSKHYRGGDALAG